MAQRRSRDAQVLQLKVTLLGCSPPIWRRLRVLDSASLHALHGVLQEAMGWENSHLYQFTLQGHEYVEPHPDNDIFDEPPRDARRAKLRDFQLGAGDRFTYLYDFGDHWEHEVLVEEGLPPTSSEASPCCIDGARACPPEDCGGIPGHEALVNPRHPDHRSLMQWAGGFDPEAFDLEQVNRRLQGQQKRAMRWPAATPPITRIQPGERIPVPLNQLHRSLILEHAYISPELEARLRKKAVSLDLDDLDELCGAVAAEMNHCEEERLRMQWRGLYDHLHAIENRYTDEDLPVTAVLSRLVQPVTYTPKQGQYLAFIYTWTKLHGIAPSEAEMQAYFKVSAPTVHQMIRTLEDRGFIERIPKQPRSIRLLIAREELPELE